MPSHRVAIVVPATFTLFELGVAVEAFAAPWYDVAVCTAQPSGASARGGLFTAQIAHGMEAVDAADTIVVPEARSVDDPAELEVLAALRRAHDRGARLASFCSGAFVLAAAGVLDGRRATTHWKYARQLAERYPQIQVEPNVLYVDEGHVLTSAGTAAGVDLSLHMIRSDHGAAVARQIARAMVVPPHREGGQAQYIMTPVPTSSGREDGVNAVLVQVADNLDRDYSVAEMAAMAIMSPRHFSRRFREATGTTPNQWLLSMRLTRVRELLEETDESIDTIARLVGFGSSITLRHHFLRTLQTSPSAYRKTFREPTVA
ncbi:helix-turn-helix domain-containing protein [Kribbella antibiotica]|uniref:helix-turn-helix domain-containing protein n=1 Tax=Kribbella antibiotica TaxID=190195 RepID=UPI0014047EBE|nr:helix-turn-helix domain-containing protein [Kribbella antibiotica]